MKINQQTDEGKKSAKHSLSLTNRKENIKNKQNYTDSHSNTYTHTLTQLQLYYN